MPTKKYDTPLINMSNETNYPYANGIIKHITVEEWHDLLHHTHDGSGSNGSSLEAKVDAIIAALNVAGIEVNIEEPNDGEGATPIEVVSVEEMAAAIENAADGDVITIKADMNTNTGAIIFNGKNVTLDFGGKTLSASNSTGGNLTISNGTVTIDGDGIITAKDAYDSTHTSNVIKVDNGGELIINSMNMDTVVGSNTETVDKGQYGIGVEGNGKLTVNDGTFKAGWFCVNTHGTNTTNDAEIVINGGTFTSASDYVIYMAANTLTTINGGKFTGGAGVLSMNNGTCIINDGEFFVTDEGDTGEGSDGTTGQANSLFNLNAKYGDCTLEIHNGKFTVGGTAPLFKTGTAHNADIKIYGGKFNVKPDPEYIADGFLCSEEKGSDGFYEVYRG